MQARPDTRATTQEQASVRHNNRVLSCATPDRSCRTRRQQLSAPDPTTERQPSSSAPRRSNACRKKNARALLAELMASLPAARAVIETEIAKVEPVDPSVYHDKAQDIVWSDHYVSSGEVRGRLGELMGECKEDLPSTQAFAVMVDILRLALDTDGVHKQLFGDMYDNFDSEIAEELQGLAADMSPEEKGSISGVVDALERMMKVMEDGHGLEHVLTQMRGGKKAGVEEVSRD